jgi:hypothetical protein
VVPPVNPHLSKYAVASADQHHSSVTTTAPAAWVNGDYKVTRAHRCPGRRLYRIKSRAFSACGFQSPASFYETSCILGVAIRPYVHPFNPKTVAVVTGRLNSQQWKPGHEFSSAMPRLSRHIVKCLLPTATATGGKMTPSACVSRQGNPRGRESVVRAVIRNRSLPVATRRAIDRLNNLA